MVVNNRRSEMEIIRDILSLTHRGDGAKKTQILYQTNLSYTQLKDYLSFLLKKEFVRLEENGSAKLYVATTRGCELLGNIDKAIQCLKQ